MAMDYFASQHTPRSIWSRVHGRTMKTVSNRNQSVWWFCHSATVGKTKTDEIPTSFIHSQLQFTLDSPDIAIQAECECWLRQASPRTLSMAGLRPPRKRGPLGTRPSGGQSVKSSYKYDLSTPDTALEHTSSWWGAIPILFRKLKSMKLY
jgi:hypothetical protein